MTEQQSRVRCVTLWNWYHFSCYRMDLLLPPQLLPLPLLLPLLLQLLLLLPVPLLLLLRLLCRSLQVAVSPRPELVRERVVPG